MILSERTRKPVRKSTPIRISTKFEKPLLLRERVYQMLRERIQFAEIGMDERLVDYDIAEALAVSRMPVREALLQLQHEGLLVSTARGFVLRRFSLEEVRNVFEVRELIEPTAAMQAAGNTTKKGLAQMRDALNATRAANEAGVLADFMRNNARYRSAWLAMVPNQVLASTIARFIDHAQVMRLATMNDPDVREYVVSSTSAMYDGFVAGDQERVRNLMIAHVRAARDYYFLLYEKGQLSPGTMPTDKLP